MLLPWSCSLCDHGHVGGQCPQIMSLTSSPLHFQPQAPGLAQAGDKQACRGQWVNHDSEVQAISDRGARERRAKLPRPVQSGGGPTWDRDFQWGGLEVALGSRALTVPRSR